jgi:hypothetical protein
LRMIPTLMKKCSTSSEKDLSIDAIFVVNASRLLD